MRPFVLAASVALLACAAPSRHVQAQSQAVTYRSPSGTTLRLLLDEANLGAEISLGEMTFPPNLDSGEHAHDAIEVFYVLSGQLEHVVNGKRQILTPGMAGFVRPPDKVRHKTGPGGPVKYVVVWVRGMEART